MILDIESHNYKIDLHVTSGRRKTDEKMEWRKVGNDGRRRKIPPYKLSIAAYGAALAWQTSIHKLPMIVGNIIHRAIQQLLAGPQPL